MMTRDQAIKVQLATSLETWKIDFTYTSACYERAVHSRSRVIEA